MSRDVWRHVTWCVTSCHVVCDVMFQEFFSVKRTVLFRSFKELSSSVKKFFVFRSCCWHQWPTIVPALIFIFVTLSILTNLYVSVGLTFSFKWTLFLFGKCYKWNAKHSCQWPVYTNGDQVCDQVFILSEWNKVLHGINCPIKSCKNMTNWNTNSSKILMYYLWFSLLWVVHAA